jgi:dGTPase
VRIVDYLEKDGKGMNLTYEVRDGILNHQTAGTPHTLEGKVIQFSDKIAYLHHDMDDAIRGKILTDDDVPDEIANVLGRTLDERLDTFVHDIITTSYGRPVVEMSPRIYDAFQKFRKFMFENVYTNPRAKGEEKKAMGVVEQLYRYYIGHIELLPKYLIDRLDLGDSKERIVCDYISSMTDRFAIARYEEIYVPKCWQ